jgi:eukaryotic-like serine/threonine-protein kinase
MAMAQRSEGEVLLRNESRLSFPALSPGGQWIAYTSEASGRAEIYVQRYPQLGHRQRISTDGGTRPLWSHDGRELFFLSLDGRHVLAVPMRSSATTLDAGRPQVLFEAGISIRGVGSWPYDVASDGRFFILRDTQTESSGTPSSMAVVLNWTEELKRLVRTN